MGFFGGKNTAKSKSTATTLIAEGCTIQGDLKVTNQLQVDGVVEGQVEAQSQVKISTSGKISGEVTTERLIVNGNFEGTCYATYIEVLSCGHISGTVYTDNLSIELGGKFVGITKPPRDNPAKTQDTQTEPVNTPLPIDVPSPNQNTA